MPARPIIPLHFLAKAELLALASFCLFLQCPLPSIFFCRLSLSLRRVRTLTGLVGWGQARDLSPLRPPCQPRRRRKTPLTQGHGPHDSSIRTRESGRLRSRRSFTAPKLRFPEGHAPEGTTHQGRLPSSWKRHTQWIETGYEVRTNSLGVCFLGACYMACNGSCGVCFLGPAMRHVMDVVSFLFRLFGRLMCNWKETSTALFV